MVVPPICVFAKSKDTIHDIVIYVGTKNWGVINANNFCNWYGGFAVYYIFSV
jgi:hypothetical protein